MHETSLTKKFASDKVAFFGLFVLGLLFAFFITYSRHTRPLRAGRDFIADFKRDGLSMLLDTDGWESHFIIKNAQGRTVGFVTDVFLNSQTPDKLSIQAASYSYMRSGSLQEQAAYFESDDSFDEFMWRSENVTPAGRSGMEILRDEDGMVTVTRLGPNKKQSSYNPPPDSVPDFLIDLLLRRFAGSSAKKILVNTIRQDGTMLRILISRTKKPFDSSFTKDDGQVLNVHLLDGTGFTHQVYLNNEGQISQAILNHGRIYLLERADMDDLLREFPEHAEDFLKKGRIPKQN